ncbi:UNVERIFIED_CONTAM: hypothetical protein FKN15_029104 [Acipenser sinensis]
MADTDMDLEWEEPERPAPRRGESEHPAPRMGEPECPVPRRGEPESPAPLREAPLSSVPQVPWPEGPTPVPTTRQESRWIAYLRALEISRFLERLDPLRMIADIIK